MKIYNPSLLSTDITGSIRLTNEATASLIGQLSSSLDNRYILSGSVSNADWDTLLNRPEDIFSGSFNDIPQNPFTSESAGITVNNNLVPTGDEEFDLGSPEKKWRDLYLSGSSVYLGTNKLGFNENNELVITDDENETVNIIVNQIRLKDNNTGNTATLTFDGTSVSTTAQDNTGADLGVEPTSNLSGSFTGSFFGEIISTNGVVSGSSQVVGILSSLNTYTSSNDTTNTTQNNRLDGLSTESGSIRTTLNSYTESNDTTNTTQNNRLDGLSTFSGSATIRLNNLETNSGSYARTDVNNTFSGLQTFTNINVDGTASFAYIQSTTGSSTSIGEAFIILNENTPASNFAGIKVVDSGSSFTTSSFVYDGLSNQWVFQHEGSVNSGSAVAIFGPLSQGDLGTEQGLTENKVPKAVTTHGHHIADSNITDSGTLITLGSDTVISGTIVATGTTLVSGSSQIALNSTTGTLCVNKGGTGQTSYVNGELLIGNTTGNTLTKATLTAGTGITITNGGGSISIAGCTGTVTSVGGTGTVAGLSLSGTVTSTGNLTLGGALSTPVSTINDSTTVGQNLVKLANPSAIRFIRINANNTVDALSDSDFRTAIGAYASSNPSGYTTNTGTVTSIATGNGITGGTITTTGTLGLTGQALALHNLASNGLIARCGTGAVVNRTITGTTNQVTVSNGDGVSGNPTLSTPQSIHTAACVQFGSFGVGTAASGTTGEIRATNEITAFYSDDRLKTKLGKIENALQKLKELNGYYFVENETAKSLGYSNDKRQVGVSAQEVQAVLPEVVTTAPISDEYLTVRYEKIVPLLIEAVKEQNNIVETLINEIEELKNTINNRG